MSMTIEAFRSLLDTKLIPLKPIDSFESFESLEWNQEIQKKEFMSLYSNVSKKLVHLTFHLLTHLDSQFKNTRGSISSLVIYSLMIFMKNTVDGSNSYHDEHFK